MCTPRVGNPGNVLLTVGILRNISISVDIKNLLILGGKKVTDVFYGQFATRCLHVNCLKTSNLRQNWSKDKKMTSTKITGFWAEAFWSLHKLRNSLHFPKFNSFEPPYFCSVKCVLQVDEYQFVGPTLWSCSSEYKALKSICQTHKKWCQQTTFCI